MTAAKGSDPYDPNEFPPFAVTADLVVLAVRPPSLDALLVRRTTGPHTGKWALPGGFVAPDQGLSAAAQFKLSNKTGVEIERSHLEQLHTFGAPERDERMRVVSVAYLALVADLQEPELEDAKWISVASLRGKDLAFDHMEILEHGIERARSKLEYTTLATTFCGPEFTMAELRSVDETACGQGLDAANFNRKVMATEGFVEATGRTESTGRGPPARTFVAGPATMLHPPIVR